MENVGNPYTNIMVKQPTAKTSKAKVYPIKREPKIKSSPLINVSSSESQSLE